jgi:hypothetical protein
LALVEEKWRLYIIKNVNIYVLLEKCFLDFVDYCIFGDSKLKIRYYPKNAIKKPSFYLRKTSQAWWQMPVIPALGR